MKREIIDFIRKVTYCNIGRKKCINENALPVLSCKKEDISYIASSNNIVRFSFEGQIYYFKECRIHSDIHSYVKEVLNDYFENVCSYVKGTLIKQYIENDLKNSANFRRLKKINEYVEDHYGVIKGKYKGWNVGEIGFPSLFEAYLKGKLEVIEFMDNYGSDFVSYIRNEIYAFDLNNYVKTGYYQTFRTSISIATKKLATLFGLEDMVPDSWYIKLMVDEISKIGIVTKKCEGICPLDLPKEKKLDFTYNFQKELLRMNYFDAVCFQRDHKEENYFVDFNEEGKVDQVIALDNDSPMTFFPLPKLSFTTSVFCSPVCYGTKPNRPYIDKDFYEKVMAMQAGKVFHTAKEELPVVQRLCVILRFQSLKKIASRTEVLKDKEWSAKTIDKEISGEYGKTYLKHYIECDEKQLISEIMGVE